MERTKKNKLFLFGLLMVIVLALPLTVFILQKQQENRSKASAATTLYFAPEATTASPIQKTIGDAVSIDLMVNPGVNLVSIIRYTITYNPQFLTPATSNAFVLNSVAFQKNLEGPIYDPVAGTISGSVSIGSDPTYSIQSLTKVATLNFKAIAQSNGTTPIGFTSDTQVYSIAVTEISNENVLSSAIPTILSINPAPTPTVDPNTIRLQVTSSLRLDKTTMFLGETIKGTVTYKNNNAFAVTIESALINGRDPNGNKNDFTTAIMNRELLPGESVTLTAPQTLKLTDPTGTYSAFESYKLSGQSAPTIGTSMAFYTVNAPLTPTPTTQACLQVITYAKNPTTNECKSYSTPCNVPAGWQTVDECPAAATGKLTVSPQTCTIPFGQTDCAVTISWTTTNATNVRLDSTPVAVSGSQSYIINRVGSASASLYANNVLLDTVTYGAVNGPTPTPDLTSNFAFRVFLHGIGASGDNMNVSALGSNKNPLTKTRNLQFALFDISGTEMFTSTVPVTYDPLSGSFNGEKLFGPENNFNLPEGIYQLRVKTDRHLRKQVAIIKITHGISQNIPAVTLVNGDANNDNTLNILDYNMIMDCYSDVLAARACTDANKKLMTDITDDGKVNQYDYNLFLRELSVQAGQ